MLDIAIILLTTLILLCFQIRESIRTTIIGLLFSGLILQILNNFVDKWSHSQLHIALICGLLFSAGLNVHFSWRGFPQLKRFFWIRSIGVALFLLSLTFIAHRSQTIGLVSYLSGEDNAKWANLLNETLSGEISASSVNGAGGLGTAFLILGNSFAQLGLTPGEVLPVSHEVLNSTFMTQLLVIISFFTLLVLSATNHSKNNLARRLALTVIVCFIILNTSSFGFLTFNCALLAILACSDYAFPSDYEPSNMDYTLLLLCFGTVSFTWLPLAVLLPPLELFIILRMSMKVKRSGTSVGFLAIGLVVIFLSWKYLFSTRINYFFTRGSGGDYVWRELLISGGGTPLVTASVVLAIGILILANINIDTRNFWTHRLFIYMNILIILPVCFVMVVSQFLDGNSSYAINKIVLFALLLFSILSLPALKDNSGIDTSSSLGVATLAILIFIFGGDFQSSTARIIGASTTSAIKTVDRPWIEETLDDLAASETLSVGCINVDQAGMLTAPNGPVYQCSRALIGLAGGEERLIGLHAFTSSRYTTIEMAASLKFYLGNNLTESVLVLDSTTSEVIERVSLHVLISAIETGSPVVKR